MKKMKRMQKNNFTYYIEKFYQHEITKCDNSILTKNVFCVNIQNIYIGYFSYGDGGNGGFSDR